MRKRIKQPDYEDLERCMERAEAIREMASAYGWIEIVETGAELLRQMNSKHITVGDVCSSSYSPDSIEVMTVALALWAIESFAADPNHEVHVRAKKLLKDLSDVMGEKPR